MLCLHSTGVFYVCSSIISKKTTYNTYLNLKIMLLENDANRLAQGRVATKLQFVKNTISAKHNKTKHNKTRYVCTIISMGQLRPLSLAQDLKACKWNSWDLKRCSSIPNATCLNHYVTMERSYLYSVLWYYYNFLQFSQWTI